MIFRKILAIMTAVLLLVSLAACSAGEGESKTINSTESTNANPSESATNAASEDVSDDNDQDSGSMFPITIEHAFGQTVIESKPERVATIAWANQDTPLALGIVPVGFSMANFGPVDEYGMHSWTAAKVAELGEADPNVFSDTDGLDYEAINDAQPDIILAAYSGLTQEEYDLLSQIAPVIAYPRAAWQTYWREQIVINSTAIGLAAEGEQYIAEMEQLIEATTSKYPELDDITGAFLWIDASDLSSFYLYFPVDTRAAYLIDLGIEFPESLNELQTDEGGFTVSISAEHIDVLEELDIIVAYGDAGLLEALQIDPIFSTVPAVKSGAVALIDSNSDLAGAATPSALSIPAVIDEYVELLAEAAARVK